MTLSGYGIMEKVRLLQLITLSELGGAQKVLYHLVAGLNRERFEITVACAPGGELVHWLSGHEGVRIVEVPYLCREVSPLRDLSAFCFLHRLMRRERFHIVHCHSSKAGILGRLAACLAGVPGIVFTVHGWGINDYQSRAARLLFVLAERLAGRASSRVVCVSQADLQKGLELGLAPPSRLAVIHNGLPEPPFKPGALRRELGLDEDALLVGMVCRLRAPKDPLFFLQTARALLSTGKWSNRLYFVLIGDGPLMAGCREFVARHGLAGKVFLPGGREDAPSLLGDLDVFVLFSLWEGLPLTIIEAMYAAKPVVAAAVGGVGELVVPGETGFLVPPRDPVGAAKALEALLEDARLRREMGEKAGRLARERFSVERMVKNYTALYEEILPAPC
ncbi:Glycosyltransferase involved in cell wall bisynthesis [Desulfofundulus thermosubterraneus DSM 16057]|uniref:Glycosyltransferase involved in cell wall bisynthesis n=2 Tax=Desulfofundulus TaxID=2282741 RepID=A0A1M6FSH5_9FIRM|nr:Glycosyltransferase involved in cell wall bisynthesis [Desulfofundulus thermosubterraneus DSM 16057]